MKSLTGENRSDYNKEMDERLLDLLDENRIATIGLLRNLYHKRYGIKPTWITFYKHLDNLIEKEKVIVDKNLGNKKRKIRIYKVNMNNIT